MCSVKCSTNFTQHALSKVSIERDVFAPIILNLLNSGMGVLWKAFALLCSVPAVKYIEEHALCSAVSSVQPKWLVPHITDRRCAS